MPRWAGDVTVLRLNTGITANTICRGKPNPNVAKMSKIYISNEPISRTLLSKCDCCMILNKTIWYRDIEIFYLF